MARTRGRTNEKLKKWQRREDRRMKNGTDEMKEKRKKTKGKGNQQLVKRADECGNSVEKEREIWIPSSHCFALLSASHKQFFG